MESKVPASPGPSDRSANMRANRRRDTGPELRVRRLLHASGVRYRVDYPIRAGAGRPVRPDIAFTRHRLAVFIDGCFWHGCAVHYTSPRANSTFWAEKVAGNRARDIETEQALVAAGWTVIRAWEHEPTTEVVHRIETVLSSRRPSL